MDFAQLDHEVVTAGSPAAEGEQIAGLIQENLTPEEQSRLKEIYPVLIEFNELMFKAQNGLYPDEVEKMASINEQGVPIEQGSGTRVPQDMQSEAMVPSRPVEGQVPQNAPEMMGGGGKVDRFDPEGKGYDEETYRRIGSPKFFDERTQEMHGPSASPISELIEKGVLTEEEVKKYSIPMKGSLLLKGMNHETTALELEDIKGEYTYKKMPTPLGERYIAFPVKKHYGMATGGGVAAGPIGVVDKPGADNSGVADDVPAESDGFVINAAAVRHAGLRDINDMIQDAVTYAEKQGMKLNFGKTPVDAEQILVSNGEVVIPDVIANIIGYDRLEKINNRGKKETEEKIQQQEQQPAPTRQPAQPVMQAAEGGEVFPAESALIQHERDKSRELATEVYEALTKPETGGEKDPFIRTRVAEGKGSSAYGPVQITKGLMEDPNYSDIVDPSEFEARQRLIEQSDKFLKYGNKDWQKLLNEGKISREEAEEAQALYEYGMPGNFVRTEKDKEDYKNYAITVIDKMLKELNIKDMNDKKKLIKFIRRWRGVDTDSQYEKDVLEIIFPSSKKNLDK